MEFHDPCSKLFYIEILKIDFEFIGHCKCNIYKNFNIHLLLK